MSIGRDTSILTPQEQSALEMIKSHKALIKVISDFRWDEEKQKEVEDFTDIDFYLDQMIDPNGHRPSRSEYFYSHTTFGDDLKPVPDVVKKINLRTKKIHDHHPGKCRFTKHHGKDYQFTPKTSTSLLPASPEFMEVFDDDAIGFMWNIDFCDIKKEKYVFPVNAGTSSCFWFGDDVEKILQELKEREEDCAVTTVAKLRENNDKAVAEKKTIPWNEILAGLPRGRLDAMFAPRDNLAMRLRTLRAMERAKEKLGSQYDIPIFIIQSDIYDNPEDPSSPEEHRPPVFRLYTAEERKADLEAARKIKHPLVAKIGLFAPSIAKYDQVSDLRTSLASAMVGF